MLKVVVFDSGYGGEFFADRLEEELPVLKVIRVIDWRNADKFLTSPREARKIARADLKPYIGKVDLIILANHLLSITSLKYFQRKYKEQKFVGLNLKEPDTFRPRDTLVLTTKAVARTINYYNFLFHLKRPTRTLAIDHWPKKIDDGELGELEINETLNDYLAQVDLRPEEVILACAQFDEIKPEIIGALGPNLKIYDSFEDTMRRACKALNLRGGIGRKAKK